MQSSGRKDEIRLHYTSQQDSVVHVETFPYRLADNLWHQLAVSVSGSQVEVLVDCHPVYRRLLRLGAPDRNLTIPQLQLWVGQRNNRHSLFKVFNLTDSEHIFIIVCIFIYKNAIKRNTIIEVDRSLNIFFSNKVLN